MMKKIKEGFPEQRQIIVGKELLKRQQKLPVSRHLYITDIGHFPRTKHHYVSRKHGAEQYIMILCASGRGHVALQKRALEISAGQLILISPKIAHHYEANPATPWNIYWFHFHGKKADEYTNLLHLDHTAPLLHISDIDLMIQQFERLYASVVSAFSDSALIRASTELAQTLSLINHLKTGRHKKSRQSENRILASIQTITQHYEQPHTLEELAQNASLSVPHYTALFRKQTGTSPLRYLTRVRMRHACELLDTTNQSISEIAQAVGYDDAFYFSRAFHKNMGHAPSTYRKLTTTDR